MYALVVRGRLSGITGMMVQLAVGGVAVKAFLPSRPQTRTAACCCKATDGFDVLVEPKSGIQFPKTVQTWRSDLDTMRLLGVGCREKKILMLGVKVYAVAAYVEGAKAEREFGMRQRGGFFEADSGVGEYCDAVLDAACSKLLVLQLVRDITGAQFVEALNEALGPRMQLGGETELLEDFSGFFQERDLVSGTQVLLLWDTSACTLEVKLLPSEAVEYASVSVDRRFESTVLCRALFEQWLGESSKVPEARKSFAAGVKQLIETDDVSRKEWKPGGRGTDIK